MQKVFVINIVIRRDRFLVTNFFAFVCKMADLRYVIIFLALSLFDKTQAECAMGWTHYNNSCYMFSSDAYNWFTAEASCREHKGKLAEPENRDQTNFLINMAHALGHTIGKEPVKEKVACEHEGENSKIKMECSANKTIRILTAFYGRTDRSTCPGDITGTTSCSAITALSKVKEKCQNRQSCTVEASNTLFGDPCSGALKYLTVRYQCDYSYWIGGRDDVIEGTWQWSSTEKILTYAPWWPGQPDDTHGTEDCLEISCSTETCKFNDRSCTDLSYYICQRSYPYVQTEIIG